MTRQIWFGALAASVIALAGERNASAQIVCPEPSSREEARVMARDNFTAAQEAYENGQPMRALAHYQCSYEIIPHPATLFNVAILAESLGDVEVALAAYREYISRFSTEESIDDVRERMEALEARVAAAAPAEPPPAEPPPTEPPPTEPPPTEPPPTEPPPTEPPPTGPNQLTPGTITPAEPPFPGGSTTYQPGGQPQMGQQLMLAPAPDDFGDSGTATTGWSLAAGIAGVALSATILGFGLGSEYLVDSDGAASAGLGITALTALVVTGPVVSAGSRSARSYTVRGCRGCRIPAWILYGLSVLGGLITVAAPLATGEDPPYGLITADTVMGTVAGLLFSIDAFVAYSQARRQVRQNERTSEVGPPNEPELAETPDRDGRTARRAIPFFAPVTSPAGGTGGVLGLTLDI